MINASVHNPPMFTLGLEWPEISNKFTIKSLCHKGSGQAVCIMLGPVHSSSHVTTFCQLLIDLLVALPTQNLTTLSDTCILVVLTRLHGIHFYFRGQVDFR